MARNSVWVNNDGLEVGFGTIDTENPQSASLRTVGKLNQIETELVYDNLPAAGAVGGKVFRIPANSTITRAWVVVEEGFTSAGATTLDIGLQEKDGTVIDADGIDAAIALTAIDTVGEVVVHDGALVGGVVTIGDADGYVYVTVGTGPYTAGKGVLTVEYLLP